MCPNCAATLPTHCGRNKPPRIVRDVRRRPSVRRSRGSGTARSGAGRRRRRGPGDQPGGASVERPAYAQLVADLRELSWVAVGAKYGVSDNAVRKWMRRYERERAA